jgi:hypothetical protein
MASPLAITQSSSASCGCCALGVAEDGVKGEGKVELRLSCIEPIQSMRQAASDSSSPNTHEPALSSTRITTDRYADS